MLAGIALSLQIQRSSPLFKRRGYPKSTVDPGCGGIRLISASISVPWIEDGIQLESYRYLISRGMGASFRC